MKWLVSRLKEPSTHAALGSLAAISATMFPQYAGLIAAIGGLFGAAGVVVKEAKNSGVVQ